MSYCAFQVFPPSCVAYCRWSLAVIVASRAPAAVIPIQSGNFPDESAPTDGGAIFFQCPPSVVRAMAPLRPTIQEILSETAVPASQSSCDGLVCKIRCGALDVSALSRPPENFPRWCFHLNSDYSRRIQFQKRLIISSIQRQILHS